MKHYMAIIVILSTAAVFATACSRKDPVNYGLSITGCPQSTEKTGEKKYILYSSDNNFTVPDTVFQKAVIIKGNKNKTQISVTAFDSPYKNDTPQKKKFSATRFITLNNTRIKLKAASINKKYLSQKDKISAVENFVHTHISDKKSGISIIPADMIFEGRSGDCTEHAVLVVTLLHAMNIPARVPVGLITEKDTTHACGKMIFHMWVQAWDGKEWIYVDASMPLHARHPSAYIVLGFHSLKTEMPLSYLKAVSAIKDLQVRIE